MSLLVSKTLHSDSLYAMLTSIAVRTPEYILHKFRDKPPSLILHLLPTSFRFDQQDGSWSYNSPMRFILEHLKEQTVPHEMLEELLKSNVIFYDGRPPCLCACWLC